MSNWIKDLERYEKLCQDCNPNPKYTKDEDLVVGDIVKHSFTNLSNKLVKVVKLTDYYIWYQDCDTFKHAFRDFSGDLHIYGHYRGNTIRGSDFRQKRYTKVLDNWYDEKSRGQIVYKYVRPIECKSKAGKKIRFIPRKEIWIKEDTTDIMC
tara:strand:+ start:47 stop:502 length:456 start_codon:yes stop_codon:yes gene_type:complete